MSDSDLDDLPLATGESEDEDDVSDDENVQRIDADSERKRTKKEAQEKKQTDVNVKANEYLQNALSSLRSQSGIKPKQNTEIKTMIAWIA